MSELIADMVAKLKGMERDDFRRSLIIVMAEGCCTKAGIGWDWELIWKGADILTRLEYGEPSDADD